MFPSYEKRPKPIVFGKSPGKGLALPGDSAELLVASAAGRTASSGLFLRFAGRAASGGSLSRLVRCTAGGGFIGRTAGRTSPAGQIGKRHDVYLRLCLSNIFRSQTYLSVASVLKQVRTFLLLSHFFVTYCINFNLNQKKLPAIRSFYRMLLNPRKRLETQGFKQVNNSIPVIRSRPLLRVSRELAREKSREDIGFWNVKDKASVDCRDVTSQQTCTLYQPKTSYKTGKRTSEDARFFILWR